MNVTDILDRAAVPGNRAPRSTPRRSKNHPYIKFLKHHDGVTDLAAPRAVAGTGAWNVTDLCAAYNWPSGLTGAGVIAIVECGGGWLPSDLQQFCTTYNIPVPSVTDVALDGTTNTPGADPDSDGEVALDIQVAAASYFAATGQAATIRMYWSTDIAAAVRAATADGCDVCSISWGADEARWGAPGAEDMEQAAADATNAGMVVFAASGDNDSSDGGPHRANVDVPSTCPHVIGCGGTRKLHTSAPETVWNNNPGHTNGEGTGGGFSKLFKPMPEWQIGAPNGPGRMVPDVSANADPETGYNIVLKGIVTPVGGTSAVAPLYAGLFAAFGTKLGFITPTLYLNQLAFTDITQGDNGAYRARPGPDACTGIGSPLGAALAVALIQPTTAQVRELLTLRAENARLRTHHASGKAA